MKKHHSLSKMLMYQYMNILNLPPTISAQNFYTPPKVERINSSASNASQATTVIGNTNSNRNLSVNSNINMYKKIKNIYGLNLNMFHAQPEEMQKIMINDMIRYVNSGYNVDKKPTLEGVRSKMQRKSNRTNSALRELKNAYPNIHKHWINSKEKAQSKQLFTSEANMIKEALNNFNKKTDVKKHIGKLNLELRTKFKNGNIQSENSVIRYLMALGNENANARKIQTKFRGWLEKKKNKERENAKKRENAANKRQLADILESIHSNKINYVGGMINNIGKKVLNKRINVNSNIIYELRNDPRSTIHQAYEYSAADYECRTKGRYINKARRFILPRHSQKNLYINKPGAKYHRCLNRFDRIIKAKINEIQNIAHTAKNFNALHNYSISLLPYEFIDMIQIMALYKPVFMDNRIQTRKISSHYLKKLYKKEKEINNVSF